MNIKILLILCSVLSAYSGLHASQSLGEQFKCTNQIGTCRCVNQEKSYGHITTDCHTEICGFSISNPICSDEQHR